MSNTLATTVERTPDNVPWKPCTDTKASLAVELGDVETSRFKHNSNREMVRDSVLQCLSSKQPGQHTGLSDTSNHAVPLRPILETCECVFTVNPALPSQS
ncbi:hypothetical protein Q8A73_009593 [Channa argus]|nr:hypothetical protein Q8A73_009593 [Channa argus]